MDSASRRSNYLTAFDKVGVEQRALHLSTAINREMATPSAVEFRIAYQQHRKGAASGARGQAPGESQTAYAQIPLLQQDVSRSGGVYGEDEIYEQESGYADLLQWRLSYQAHRSGAAKGSRGEIGAGLSIQAVRMLPVAREAAHVRQLRDAEVAKEDVTPPPSGEPVRAVHVHVGAGRLGLGLVVPALARGARANNDTLILLQRPSGAWDACKHGSVVAFIVNAEVICRVKVVREAEPGEVTALLTEPFSELRTNDELDGLLVLSQEPDLLDQITPYITSLSCSLGPALQTGLDPLLDSLRRVGIHHLCGGWLRLYAAENDHDAVEKLGARPELAELQVWVIPLLVDRVCTDRVISEKEIGISSEEWGGEIVMMTPGANKPYDADKSAKAALHSTQKRKLLVKPPFAGDNVRFPASSAEAHFLHRRKILTVNGTHTTLAFLTLATNEPPPHTGLPQGDYELLRAVPRDKKPDDLSNEEAEEEELKIEETYRMVWAWAVARQLLLLFESSAEVARAALNCGRPTAEESDIALADTLLEGARVAIHRLGKGGDMTKRILGGGVVNRFETRLKPIATFVDPTGGSAAQSKWIRGSLPKLIVRRAKLTETSMRLLVLGLVTDAERFTVNDKAATVVTPAKPKSPAGA